MVPSSIYLFLIAAGASFILCLILTPAVRRMALATGQVAVPKGDRWHKKQTALLGGVGIFVSMVGVWALLAFLLGWKAYGNPYLPMMACASAMFLLGLADDIRDMDPQHKLAGQIIVTCIVVFLG
ncbi:MAG: hypothetical protein WAL98_19480, partial [Desulfatiglandaceae bacterium]